MRYPISIRRRGAITFRGGATAMLIAFVFVGAVSLETRGLAAATNFQAMPDLEPDVKEQTPDGSRELFNAGTRKLREGKLREAEALLQSAVARQEEKIQPTALYNLGHVRFGEGVEELKKSPGGQQSAGRSHAAAQMGSQAIRQADAALAANEVQPMVTAYRNGRGTQKELRLATKAVQRALDVYGSVLRKWERALSDFNSAAELKPSDNDARRNAEILERAIAQLVDSIREMQDGKKAMSQQEEQLAQKLKELKGKIPEQLMPPGTSGEGDEEKGGKGDKDEEEEPSEPPPGHQEGPSREGEEIRLSSEEAAWLLQGFNLDNNRRLPMGPGETGEKKTDNRRNW